MLPSWTSDQINALAPDERSIRAAQTLTSPRHWESLAHDHRVVWGECRGSGKKPYRVRIDLGEPAFRCSCPSRKFPCKHALALFYLYAENVSLFQQQTPPDWVEEWLEARTKRAAQKTQKADEQSQSKSSRKPSHSQRQSKIAAGLQELDSWLQDLVRQGLASVQNQASDLWGTPAARLVDAQAPGAARLLLDCASIPNSGPGWPERLLEKLGQLHLLASSFQSYTQHSPAVQADLRAAVGWPERSQDILKQPGLSDRWTVLGQRVELEDRLKIQRTWLWGQQSQRYALVLSFAHGRDTLDVSLIPGISLEAELVFYPSASPLRALVKERSEQHERISNFTSTPSITAALNQVTQALAQNPWQPQFPLALADLTPYLQDGCWHLQDQNGVLLLVDPQFEDHWHLLALSGGRPLELFGEWDSRFFFPLAAWLSNQKRFCQLRSDLS